MVKVSLFTIHDNELFVGTSVQHPRAEPNNPSKDWEVEASCLGKDPTFQAVQVFKMARIQQQLIQPKLTVPSRTSMWEFDWKHAWMNNSCMASLYFSTVYKDFFVDQFHPTVDNQVRLKLPPCTRITRQHRGLPGEFHHHLLSVFLSTILSLQMVAVDTWYLKGIWQRDVQPGRSL